MLSRLESDVLGTERDLQAFDEMLFRSIDAQVKKQGKQKLIIDVDSTEGPAHGQQEQVAYNGRFGKNC